MVIIANIAGTIAIVAAIIIANTNPAIAEVVRVQSSLTATGREHACPDEPLIFTCEANGQFIQWTFDAFYRTTFFFDHSVNSVQTVSGQHGIRAVLTGNDPILSGTNSVRHLSSALMIQSSAKLSGYLHNVSCSSDTETHTQQLKIAEAPNVPLNVLVSRVQLSAPCRLSVSWDPPDNSKKFDLDHFIVHIMLPEPEFQSYIANGTSMESEYHFHSDSVMIPPQNSMHVAVTAVSKCSLSGPSFRVELNPMVNDRAMFTSVHDVISKTESGPEEYIFKQNIMTSGYKEVFTNEHKVILTFILAMSILFSP